jgi:hypothetical protein
MDAHPPARHGISEQEVVMARVICEVSEGLRKSEATVKLVTFDGRPEFLPVDRGLVTTEGDRNYLSVGLVHVSHDKKAALVSLPVEADSGAHRVWVKLDSLRDEQEVPA